MSTSNDNKTLHCPLCFETFTTPRVLPCFHTFCEKCLSTYIDTQRHGGIQFMCPLCMAITTPSLSSRSIDKWATTFPLNTLVVSLLEATESKGSDDHICEPCKTDDVISTAEYCCVDCHEKMCSSCKRLHMRSKQMKHHTVLLIDEMDQDLKFNVNYSQDCPTHREKLKLYCLDHRILCCADCTAIDHRQCNDVRSIEVIGHGQSQRSSSDYANIIEDIKNMKIEIEEILSEKEANVKQVLQEKEHIFHVMDTKIDDIMEKLDKLRHAFKTETNELLSGTESSMLKRVKSIKGFAVNLENANGILEGVEKIGTPEQKFATFENVRLQLTSQYRQLKTELTDEIQMNFTLEQNDLCSDIKEMLSTLNSFDISLPSHTTPADALKDIDRDMKNLDSRTNICAGLCAAQAPKRECNSKLAFVKPVTRKKLGKRACFTDVAYLADGRIVMADYYNNLLLVLDDEYNIVKEYKVDGTPTAVSPGNEDDEIYIIVSWEMIHKCILSADLKIIKKIKSPPHTFGIAVTSESIVVSSDTAVVILTLEGTALRSIPRSGDSSSVAVSKTQRTIYHTDNDDVVCRTWEGQEVFRYQHQQLKEPHGIFVDDTDNVYICGSNSHNVHQISTDGRRSRIILDKLHFISVPLSVMFHPKKRELIVTSNNESTVCEIYKVS